MVEIITNSKGSGDWIIVKNDDGETVHSGHRITASDLMMILQNFGIFAEVVSVRDSEIEEL